MRLGLGTDISVGYRQRLFGGVPLLLDTYTGAAVAYSLRQLRTGVTNVVRVRRDTTPSAEENFTAAEVVDGTLEAFVGAGNNGYVVTWYDQSGNGNHATQATAANQPKIVDAGVLVEENGKPAVLPDGSDDYLEINSTGISIPDKSLSYLVGTYQDQSDGVYFSSVESSDYDNCISIGSNFLGTNSGVLSVRLGGASNTTRNLLSESKSGYSNGESFLTNTLVTDDFTNSETLFDGSGADGSIAHRANVNTPGAFIFRAVNYYGSGAVQELIIYDSDQSSNRAAIEQNLNTYYSIYT